MEDYHLASGAATNWGKTEGLRLGSLRGVAHLTLFLATRGLAASATSAGLTSIPMWPMWAARRAWLAPR